MITVTITTPDYTITEFRTEDPARALEATYSVEDDDDVSVDIDQSLGCDAGRVVLRAWANFLASQTTK